MRLTSQKSIQDPPMSDTRHLSDLRFDERPLLSMQPAEGPRTDVMMLEKADVWMSQFKTRLNIAVIGLLVMWGTVSYYKSTSVQLAAHAVPEKILADGSAEDGSIPAVETVETENTALVTPAVLPKVEEKAELSPPPSQVKKSAGKKALSQKSARLQKKLKKSVASKPAP